MITLYVCIVPDALMMAELYQSVHPILELLRELKIYLALQKPFEKACEDCGYLNTLRTDHLQRISLTQDTN